MNTHLDPKLHIDRNLHYLIADPTGNITILVLDPVPVGKQPAAAAELMEKEPSAEQVGFLTLPERSKTVSTDQSSGAYDIALRMAGGEFCGNASMSAAAYCAWHAGLKHGSFTLHVSGTALPVTVEIKLDPVADGNPLTWIGKVHMPPPAKIELVTFPNGRELPVVTFEGITHVIIREDSQTSDFSILKNSDASDCPTVQHKSQAENLAREWCDFLHADALGLLFLNAFADRLTPLVYVPGADTLFWETSCGSGSAAVGAWLAQQSGQPVSASLTQPGGTLHVTASPDGPLLLQGSIHFI